MKLFKVKKVGVFLDGVTHGTEDRPDAGQTKILILACRVQPFDSKLAGALADVVRQDLFKLGNAEPKAHLRKVEFALGVPRQQLHIFASPDTEDATLMFDQVKISKTYARSQKNVNGYAFCFLASFGPASKSELEYVENWRLGQRFINFEIAEPGLFDDADEDDDDDAAPATPRLSDEWEDDGSGSGKPAETGVSAAPDGTVAPPDSDKEPARRPTRRHADPKSAARAKQSGKKR